MHVQKYSRFPWRNLFHTWMQHQISKIWKLKTGTQGSVSLGSYFAWAPHLPKTLFRQIFYMNTFINENPLKITNDNRTTMVRTCTISKYAYSLRSPTSHLLVDIFSNRKSHSTQQTFASNRTVTSPVVRSQRSYIVHGVGFNLKPALSRPTTSQFTTSLASRSSSSYQV